jgi:MFS family permease
MVPFYKTVLHLPSSFCIYLNAITILGMGGLAYSWGKLNDYRGSRFVLFISFLLGLIFWVLMAHLKWFPPDRLNHTLIALALLGGIAGAGQAMGDSTRRFGLAPETGRVAFFSYLMIVSCQLPAIFASPLAGMLIEKHRNFRVGGYGIYEIIFLAYALMNIFFLVQFLRMGSVKERPVGEIFRDVVNENLMKVRDIIASPP